MKILYISLGREYGGTEKVVENLVGNFSEDKSNKITLVALNGTRFFNIINSKYKDSQNIKVVGLLKSKNKLFNNIISLRKLLKENEFNVIHIHSIVSNLIFQLANIGLNNHSIVTVHSRSDFDRKNFFKGILMNKLEVYLLNRNTQVVCVSNSIREYLKNKHVRNNITVIHNGIAGLEFDFNLSNRENLKGISFDKNDLLIAFVGRLTEVKGIYNLIEILKKIDKKNKNVKFIVIGEGVLKEEFNNAIYKYNLENVELLGFKQNIIEYLPSCDFLIMPSNMEGIPITILEAMSCSVPCIASNVGGIPEIINDKNGILYSNSDLDYIVDKIDFFERNRDLIKPLKINAYDDFEKKWNINNFIKLYKSIYLIEKQEEFYE
ncbi:glycosyltransferase family 4 protein [Clostridium perfringens]|nr:glycosyltransferase family 4 protein [Clostridium perfringens]MDU6635745.1 glycosyltransferase family 4 protein [Clostridium perfringens]HAT4212233.1 glycosyltransferase family 4 protein [Clostridium perfringens]